MNLRYRIGVISRDAQRLLFDRCPACGGVPPVAVSFDAGNVVPPVCTLCNRAGRVLRFVAAPGFKITDAMRRASARKEVSQ